VAGVTPGAFGVSIHRLGDSRRVLAAEVEREAGAIVIFIDGSAGLPARADARGAPDRGVGRAADPHRQIGLHGPRCDGDTLQLVEGAAEVDRVLAPEAANDIEAFVGLATARPGVD